MAKSKSSKKEPASPHNSYSQLIRQTFDFPRLELAEKNGELYFHGIRLIDLVKKYGSPLRLSYLPKISEQIESAVSLFNSQIKKQKYSGRYHYCFSTKSSQFKFVIDEVFNNEVNIETSSEFDFDIIDKLIEEKKINKKTYIIANGFKQPGYLKRIVDLNAKGFSKTICILDNREELEQLKKLNNTPLKLGIRLAIAEHPTSDIYMSRHGMKTTEVVEFYKQKIEADKNLDLRMVSFYIENGMSDTAYYWSELERHV
ncbi:MAG: arginine decarboxylase, partial [Bacteroidota bacterium]|nr:arginine decarboxylase [Bacteroidota bacterium]